MADVISPVRVYEALVVLCGGKDAAGGGCGGFLGTYSANRSRKPSEGLAAAQDLLTNAELASEGLEPDEAVIVSYRPCGSCRRHC